MYIVICFRYFWLKIYCDIIEYKEFCIVFNNCKESFYDIVVYYRKKIIDGI